MVLMNNSETKNGKTTVSKKNIKTLNRKDVLEFLFDVTNEIK
jgi:hypothetical protein